MLRLTWLRDRVGKRHKRKRRLGRDRGVVAVMVAILLGGNVLLGMSALVVDVGLFYVEREDLRNGAEAAAIAVGKRCATNAADCTQIEMTALAIAYAGRNAKDGASGATVCGRVPDPANPTRNLLDTCPPAPANLTACIRTPPASPKQYVEVRTSTLRANGDTALPPAFSGAITGSDGVSIAACSRVSWGPVTGATLKPVIAMGYCVFARATANGSVFQPPPTGPGQHHASKESETAFHWHPASDNGCPIPGTSRQYPQAFGWLTGQGFGDCDSSVRRTWYRMTSQPGTPEDCVDMLESAYDNSTPIPVAIFNNSQQTNNNNYRIRVVGIAAFVITGWWAPDDWENRSDQNHQAALHGEFLFGKEGCVKEDEQDNEDATMCLFGYFTSMLVTNNAGSPLATDYGVHSLGVIG